MLAACVHQLIDQSSHEPALLLVGADDQDGGVQLVGQHQRVASHDRRRCIDQYEVVPAAEFSHDTIKRAVVQSFKSPVGGAPGRDDIDPVLGGTDNLVQRGLAREQIAQARIIAGHAHHLGKTRSAEVPVHDHHLPAGGGGGGGKIGGGGRRPGVGKAADQQQRPVARSIHRLGNER